MNLVQRAHAPQRQKLNWFQSEKGIDLRINGKNHIHKKTPRKTLCALGNINNNMNVRRKKTDILRETCLVHLFKDSSSILKNCWDE